MERILLYALENKNIKVTIEAYFQDTGNLIVEGYDIGKTVEEYWGDSDYEYSITIPPQEIDKLYLLTGTVPGDQSQLLSYLQKNFNANDCFSRLRAFLDQHDIYHEGFSWT